MQHKMKSILTLLSLAVAVLSFSACSKELPIDSDDNSSSTSATGNNTLTVKTRALPTADGETATVSYPVNVYAFNASGKCVGVQAINKAGESVAFKFKKGAYTLYGLAGATATAYSLPSQDEATPEAVVSLKEGQQHGELMTGTASVKLSDGDDNTLILSLKRKVMQIDSVVITNVPTTVTAISVNLAPLYSALKLNGEYDGTTGNTTIALSQTAPGTWQSAAPQYLLEASSAASITVAMTADGKTQSYSYVSNDELKANYKLNIKGAYKSNEFELSGTIQGEAWAGRKDISFTISEESGEEPDEPSTPVEEDLVGTLYANNKAFVVSANENSDGSKTYLLISTSQIKTSCSNESQESAKSIIEKELNGLTKIANTTDWRLPTKEELLAFKNVKDTYKKLEGNNVEGFTYSTSTAYFYQKDADTIAALLIDGGNDKTALNGTIYLRAFTTLTVSQ